MSGLLIRGARPVRFRGRRELGRLRAAARAGLNEPPAPGGPTDLRIEAGAVVEMGPALARHDGEEVLDAGGAWLIPGLWDAHAHLDLEAARVARLELGRATRAEEALAIVAARARALRSGAADGPALIQGFGHRLSNWPRVPSVAELDAVTGPIPTVLVSGDAHSGWVNSAALTLLGLPPATSADPGAPLMEGEWFAALNRLDDIPGSRELVESGYRGVLEDMAARGITGVTDMTWGQDAPAWAARLDRMSATGPLPGLPRIRVSTYREGLEERIDAHLRTGDPLPGSPVGGDGSALLTQGPLKIISDGSMGTGTARLRSPYPADLGLAHPHGVMSVGLDELTGLLGRAHEHGMTAAVHAIGDAALIDVARAFARTGARGRVEHAQLLPADAAGPEGALTVLVRLGVELSVQPAHLIDDWAAVGRVWPGLEPRSYAFADMAAAGAMLALGSDAPVAPLDPWLAMSAAVGRRAPDGSVWSPEQRLSAEEALAASVDGAGPVDVGSRGDLVLLPDNPLRLGPEELRAVRPLATLVAGALTAHR
ncbi:amidohydrolase [Actinomyces marmotae]|uniref:Amidohydrolase family protein n=1 Tax=Actinomyces marmotae TaxID=2737173 RepID=A0A6M8B6B4_9ACTO|nr:amidohydrolase family protein [Actinomyces marmotae]QKD79636.1 amidohydrolase family protein [Actinomyces marmotae]